MEKKLYELEIDPELRDFIPSPKESEYRALEDNLIAEGCNDPLVTWNGVIIDGHNRYKICHEHNIPFAYREMEFENKGAAKVWMAENQLGRRNLNTFQKCQILIPIEDALRESLQKKAELRRREKISNYRNGSQTVGGCPPSEKTRDVIADMADTSARTFNKVKYLFLYAEPETLDAVRLGDLSINKAYSDLKRKEKEPDPESGNEATDTNTLEEEPRPVSYIDHPMEDPVTMHEPERKPMPYQFVKEQVEFAIRNMIADMKIGIYGLRNEDFDRKKELKNILKEGYKQAAQIIDEMEKMS